MSGFERGFQDAPAYMRECEQSPRGSSRKSRQKPQSSQEKEGSEASSSELVSESDKPSEDQPSEEITKPATPESESDKDSSNRASSEIRKSTTPEPKSGASRMENSQSPQPKAQPKETREELLQGPRMVAVEIHPPPESNLEEYEFLPGHFDVNYIIDETEELEPEPFYRVKLRSGEVQKARSSCTCFCRLLALPWNLSLSSKSVIISETNFHGSFTGLFVAPQNAQQRSGSFKTLSKLWSDS